MSAATGRLIVTITTGFFALLMSGCADLPAWVPFQGPRNDTLPGVVAPAEKIAQLKKLASEAPKSDQTTKQRVVGQLVAAIRNEPDALIRAEIVRTLGNYPDPSADSVLQTALIDPDADVRIAACEAWGKRGSARPPRCLRQYSVAMLSKMYAWRPHGPWEKSKIRRQLPPWARP